MLRSPLLISRILEVRFLCLLLNPFAEFLAIVGLKEWFNPRGFRCVNGNGVVSGRLSKSPGPQKNAPSVTSPRDSGNKRPGGFCGFSLAPFCSFGDFGVVFWLL